MNEVYQQSKGTIAEKRQQGHPSALHASAATYRPCYAGNRIPAPASIIASKTAIIETKQDSHPDKAVALVRQRSWLAAPRHLAIRWRTGRGESDSAGFLIAWIY